MGWGCFEVFGCGFCCFVELFVVRDHEDGGRKLRAGYVDGKVLS